MKENMGVVNYDLLANIFVIDYLKITHTQTHTHTHTHTQNGEVGLEKCYPKNTVVVVSVSQYDAFILSFLN